MNKKEALLLIKNKNCKHIKNCKDCTGYPLSWTPDCVNILKTVFINRLFSGEDIVAELTSEEIKSLQLPHLRT